VQLQQIPNRIQLDSADRPARWLPRLSQYAPGTASTASIQCSMDSSETAETPLGIKNLLDSTAEFMRRAGQLEKIPTFDNSNLTKLRRDLLAEEYAEYKNAESKADQIEIVDSLLDIIVVAWGTLLTYVGEDKAKAAAAEVARSNLDKVRVDPIKRADGKILKPSDWRAPDIRKVLQA
jgi:predicted HAD superfamily Cof-like phosphohydrolase